MKTDLYIVGAGSVGGHVALNVQQYSSDYRVAGFFDDDQQKIGTKQFGVDVLGSVNEVLQKDQAHVVIGIAFPKIKRRILQQLSANNTLHYPTLVHERAWISSGVTIGKGSIIYPGTTINFGSEIHDFVVLNANCSLGHHTRVGAYSSFAPGVNTGGHTTIEDEVEMGIGACTLQDVQVGASSIVGGQSMIIKNVKPGATVAGVPAKVLASKQSVGTG